MEPCKFFLSEREDQVLTGTAVEALDRGLQVEVVPPLEERGWEEVVEGRRGAKGVREVVMQESHRQRELAQKVERRR
jgi:hypothetical protein